MEILQNILDSSQIPVFSAFILGLMTSISPCPMATNITAISYLSKNIGEGKKVFYNGLYYTAGRAISYSVLGIILFSGASKFHVARIFSVYGEKILGPLLLITGVLMTGLIKINFPVFNKIIGRAADAAQKKSIAGPLLIGMVFALAFCPYSAVLFFGMLIPLSISSISGLYLPVVYAFATGLPVIIIAYTIAFSVAGIAGFYNKVQVFQKWFKMIVALVFIGSGIYFILIYFFGL